MKVLVTGATGFIGSRLVERLLELDYKVHVLVRFPEKLPASIRQKVEIFKGDVLDLNSINSAITGCARVFHLAAFAGIWSKDKLLPYKINVTGTHNILQAALNHNIQKIVFTSSAGTLTPSCNLKEVDEDTPLPIAFHTDYEKSKAQAEKLCFDSAGKGLNVVVVNPTRVFGPGPLNKSNAVTILIKNYISGRWRFIPGDGKSVGNYVFINDVVDGHLKAMEAGVSGGKYILGGTNISFNDFFKLLSVVSGKKYRMFHIPYKLIYAYSSIEYFFAEVVDKNPVITPPWARRYRENRLVSSTKAVEKLDYKITPIQTAVAKTIHWLSKA